MLRVLRDNWLDVALSLGSALGVWGSVSSGLADLWEASPAAVVFTALASLLAGALLGSLLPVFREARERRRVAGSLRLLTDGQRVLVREVVEAGGVSARYGDVGLCDLLDMGVLSETSAQGAITQSFVPSRATRQLLRRDGAAHWLGPSVQ